ncbi:MAG: 50S ribosomal protein L35 [Chlamydiia bacterium]|nr:50S ribosomal protein L35 [Chlamydiia bacterium]
MPKMKTNKSVLSRFKLTGRGKLLRRRPGKRHILSKKSSHRKRVLSHPGIVDVSLEKTYKRMLGM